MFVPLSLSLFMSRVISLLPLPNFFVLVAFRYIHTHDTINSSFRFSLLGIQTDNRHPQPFSHRRSAICAKMHQLGVRTYAPVCIRLPRVYIILILSHALQSIRDSKCESPDDGENSTIYLFINFFLDEKFGCKTGRT